MLKGECEISENVIPINNITKLPESGELCGIMACFNVISMVMTMLGMPYCGITMGNNIARVIHYDVTMDDIAMYT